MAGWTKFVTTELDEDQKLDMAVPMGSLRDVPDFPYGMKISFDQHLLKRLKMEPDCEVGEYIDLRCFARVTSVTKNQVNGEDRCCVEMTIEKISAEIEDDESTKPDDDDD